MLVRLKDGSGHSVVVNTDHVVSATVLFQKPVDGSMPPTPVIGKTMLLMANGAQVIVEGSVDTVYGQLRRTSPSLGLASTLEN